MSKLGSIKKRKTRIFLVDDHPLIRISLRELLAAEPDLMVCGEAEDRQEALEAIARSNPDLVIVDLKLRNSDGLDLIRDLAARHPSVLTLVLSMYDEVLHSERAIRAGASGFVSKQADAGRFVAALRKVLGGEIYWSETAAAQVATRLARPPRGVKRLPLDSLSDREMQVFESVGAGTSTGQIAAALHIDVSTVETYRARIKEKLGLKNTTELLQEAIRWNVLKTAKAAYG